MEDCSKYFADFLYFAGLKFIFINNMPFLLCQRSAQLVKDECFKLIYMPSFSLWFPAQLHEIFCVCNI